MDIFNGNRRLEDNIMYSMAWAKFLRHDITDPLIPFLLEWEGDKLYMNMLQAGGDPEEFGYKVAENSQRNSDQFVLGYEGYLQDSSGQKTEAFIIKGYDKTQEKGVFIAQLFEGKEKGGEFKLIDKPMFIAQPDLPFAVNKSIPENWESEDVYISGMVLKNGDQIGRFSHHNPAVVASGIQRYIRAKVSSPDSGEMSGRMELSVMPKEGNSAFMKYCAIETIRAEKNSELVRNWEKEHAKPLLINLNSGDEIWLEEFQQADFNETRSTQEPEQSAAEQSSQTDIGSKEHQQELERKYNQFSEEELRAEFARILNIPNARTNIQCLVEVAALMEVAKKRGIDLQQAAGKANSGKSGCMPVLLLMILLALVYYFI